MRSLLLLVGRHPGSLIGELLIAIGPLAVHYHQGDNHRRRDGCDDERDNRHAGGRLALCYGRIVLPFNSAGHISNHSSLFGIFVHFYLLPIIPFLHEPRQFLFE